MASLVEWFGCTPRHFKKSERSLVRTPSLAVIKMNSDLSLSELISVSVYLISEW
jgi:hypothetical protein